LINGYVNEHSVGIRHDSKGIPVLVLDTEEKPKITPSGLFFFKNSVLLVEGKKLSYEKCVLKLVRP
jgi:hypothetical protein